MELRAGDNRVGERLSAWAVRPADTKADPKGDGRDKRTASGGKGR